MPSSESPNNEKLQTLWSFIRTSAQNLGFADVGVSDCDLSEYRTRYDQWLADGHNGTMDWLHENTDLRFHPEKLHTGTLRVLSLRMNYFPEGTEHIKVLKSDDTAYVSRYALGRDYHKLIRKRLSRLAKQIEDWAEAESLQDSISQRPFVDSAPVLERAFAEKSGIAWIGKHTLALTEDEGSWFFLGELFTNIPLPVNDKLQENKCGTCEACLKVCPTDAFPAPYKLDARRCISYLTIEHDGIIPEEFRAPMGNRIFGCDDCQAICPWNKYASFSAEDDFKPRHKLDSSDLLELFNWTEEEFLEKTAGSAIRRTGYQNWLRNIAIALGNANSDLRIIENLERKLTSASPVLAEHIEWAHAQQTQSHRKRVRKIKNPKSL